MRSEFAYQRPRSLAEALVLLDERGPEAQVAAGMTDLMIEVKEGRLKSSLLVDITRIQALRYIEEREESICLGPLVTHAELASSEIIRRDAPVLALAAQSVGSPQIRNVGTIGGNIGNASPAADTLPALMVLGAEVVIRRKEGQRSLPIGEVFLKPYQTVLRPGEILAEISFPKLGRDKRSAFLKLGRRKALATARLNLAVTAEVKDERIQEVRLSVGSATPIPCRMREAESFLQNKKPSVEIIARAAGLTAQEMIRRSRVRASSAYKAPAVEGLTIKALKEVFFGNS